MEHIPYAPLHAPRCGRWPSKRSFRSSRSIFWMSYAESPWFLHRPGHSTYVVICIMTICWRESACCLLVPYYYYTQTPFKSHPQTRGISHLAQYTSSPSHARTSSDHQCLISYLMMICFVDMAWIGGIDMMDHSGLY